MGLQEEKLHADIGVLREAMAAYDANVLRSGVFADIVRKRLPDVLKAAEIQAQVPGETWEDRMDRTRQERAARRAAGFRHD